MTFVPVPNTVLLEFHMLYAGQQVENTLWFQLGSTPSEGSMLALANAMEGWWTDNYAPLISDDVQLVETVVTDMSSSTGPQITIVPAVAQFGAKTQDAEPGNVTLTVSFRTSSRGRSFRGRNYVVGICEDQIVQNSVLSTVAGFWVDAYTAIFDAISALDVTWVVASRFSGVDPVTGQPIPRTTGIATPITTVTVVDDFIDSQRRRLTTRGN